MSLQRRLLLYLVVFAPIAWLVAALASIDFARHEVDELFDTELIRLARQVQTTLAGLPIADEVDAAPAGGPGASQGASVGDLGEADLHDLAVAIWDAQGRLLVSDREGAQLPRRPDAVGFADATVAGEAWRVYYLQSPGGEWLVAAGQRTEEREELVWDLLASQLVPWVAVLPLLLAAMAWAVRRAMVPVRSLTAEIAARGPDDLQPVEPAQAPVEIRPMVQAMNHLFARVDAALVRERRFTADAAHELRTPLAVLRAQWDALRAAPDAPSRDTAEAALGQGLDRMDRLVTQMLALSRLEATDGLKAREPVDWPSLLAQVTGDLLPLADRRGVEIEVDGDASAFALRGDQGLLAVMLRNLLDNALRYSPRASTVRVRFEPGALVVENDGEPLGAAALARLGERFHRDDGQAETGSGLGVSIAQRAAALHGLRLAYGARADGTGVAVRVSSA